MTPKRQRSVRAIVDRLDGLTGREQITVRDIVAAFGDAAFLPLLVVPAVIVVSPLSAVPLVPTAFGLTIALVAVQMMVARRRIWLPEALLRVSLGPDRTHRALKRLRGVAAWIDRHASARMTVLVSGPFDIVPPALCAVAGLTMPFLEFVPLSASILGLAVLCLAAAILTRDGLLVLIGAAIIGLAALVPLTIFGRFAGG